MSEECNCKCCRHWKKISIEEHAERMDIIGGLKNELAAWSEVEKVSGRKRSEIYGLSHRLKPGKPVYPMPEIPTCSMAPESVKIHDEVCDILEGRGFNEDEVCTASVGVWATLGICEKQWRDK